MGTIFKNVLLEDDTGGGCAALTDISDDQWSPLRSNNRFLLQDGCVTTTIASKAPSERGLREAVEEIAKIAF